MLKNVILIVLATVLLPQLITYSSQFFSIFVKPQLPYLYARYGGEDVSGGCQIVRAVGLQHCEDVATIRQVQDEHTGYSPMLAGCDDRFAYNTVLGVFDDIVTPGTLQLVAPYKDLDGRVDVTVMPITIDDDADFDLHPLGIGVSPVNSARVFVVNHALEESRVEVLDVDYDLARAHRVASIAHPLISTPNSIAAIDDTSFYVSNDHRFGLRGRTVAGKVVNMLETFLRLPLGEVNLVRFAEGDGTVDVQRAAKHIAYANGVVAFDDKLAVGSTTTNQVLLYRRDIQTDALEYLRSIHLPFHVDNLSYDKEGGVVLASGHPHYPTLARYVRSKGKTEDPMSWVVAIEVDKEQEEMEETRGEGEVAQRRLLKGNKKDSIHSVIQSDGQFASSVTTLERNGDALVGGGLYMNGLLTCRI